jgi:hypothetical protein
MKIFIDYYIDPKTKQKIYKLNNKKIYFLRKYKESILKKKKLKKKRRKTKKINIKKNVQPIIHEIEPKLTFNTGPTDEDLPLSFYLKNSTNYTGEDSNIDYSEILGRDTLTEKMDNRNEIEPRENEEEKVLIQSKSEEKIIENADLFQEHLDKIKAKQNKISKQIRRKQLRLLEREKIKKLNKKKEVNIRYNESLNKRNIEEFIQGEKVVHDNKIPNVKKEKQIEDKLYSIEDEGFEVKDSYGKVDGLYYKVDINSTIEVPIVQDEENKIFLKIPKEDTLNKYLNVFIGTFNPDKRTIYLPSEGKYDMRFIRWIYEEKKKYIKMKKSNFYNM